MDTNTNSKYWEKITAYFSGELNREEQESIEDWAEIQDGKELLNDIKLKMKQVEKAGYMVSDKTDKAWNKLNLRIKLAEKPQISFLSRHRNLIGVAASLILMFSVGYGVYRMVQGTKQMESIHTEMDQKQLVLSDGSEVFLNGNSSLEYPAEFKGASRLVKLVGEAYFNIQPDKNHPFIIETEQARIQVLGTSFNVRSTDSEGDVEILVTSGKVFFQDIENPENLLILEKGDFASLKNKELKYNTLSDVNYLAWQTKMLVFNNTPLSEVVKTLNHAYAVKIDLANEGLGDLHLTSTYDRMNVDALLQAMCLTFHLNQKTDGDRIILYSSTP